MRRESPASPVVSGRPSYALPGHIQAHCEVVMKSTTPDEKQIILARMLRELAQAKRLAKKTELDMVAFLLAQAEEEARRQLERIEDVPEDD